MAKFYVGIDLGGTFIKFTWLDDSRKAGGTHTVPTPSGGADAVIAQMVAGALELLEKNGLPKGDMAGVGIGAPGPLNLKQGVVIDMPNLPGFCNVPIRDRVSQGLCAPAVLENDANAAAFGEYLCGAGAGRGDMVLLTLGTGVGGGIVIDGKVLHGHHDIGAELGHMIIVPDGEQCGCGQRGCLERYCSATFIAQRAKRLIEEGGRDSSLKDVLRRRGQIDAKDINEARKAGDAFAAEVWDRAAYYLAIGCVNICRALDPDEIVLAGGLTKAGEDLIKPVQEHFNRLNWRITPPLTKLAIAALGNDAGAIGAAGVAWSQFGRR